MKWFNNLKIRSKLLMVLSVLTFGFIIIASSFYQLNQTNTQSEISQNSSNDFKYSILKVSELILQARRAEKDFLLRRDEKYIKRHNRIMESVFSTFDKLEKIATIEEEKKSLLQARKLTSEYQNTVKIMFVTAIKLGLSEEQGIQGALRANVHEIEDILTKLKSLPLTVSMLSMRRHEKDFILRENDKYITRMNKEQKNFKRLLRKEKIPAVDKRNISETMKAYYKGFIDYTKANKDLRNAISLYRDKVHALAPELVKLNKITEDATIETAKNVESQRSFSSIVFISTLVITSLIAILLLLFVIRAVSAAFKRFQTTISEVAEGSSDARLNLNTKDELGELAQAFDNILDERLENTKKAEKENDTLNDSIISLLNAVSDLSQRDLTIKVPVAEDVTGPVADAMNMMASETAKVLIEIQSVAEQVESAANTVSSQGTEVSDVATKERNIVQNTMSKLEDASSTMNEISKLAQKCNTIAATASSSTSEALQSVNNTATGMNDIRETISETEKRIKRLGERSQEITGVVEIINNIAERTHVLALNASMQAAAAGDAGRGFAVVADEVQRLAESSRQSTAEIQALVSNIQTETSETMTTMNKTITQVIEGTELAQRSGEQMLETQKTTQELATAVETIASRSLLQAKSSHAVRDQANEIVDSTNQTSKALRSQSEHTESLVDFSKRLLDSVRVFKLPQT